MEKYIRNFGGLVASALATMPDREIARAMGIIQATYERDGKIYIFGNGGSLALATHWVSDFNKTVFSRHLTKGVRRFQAIRLPTTEEELTAWANDVGYEMVFAGPLENYMQEIDAVIAISSSGASPNVIKAVEFAQSRHVPVIGLSGFDGGRLNELADAKILIRTEKGAYEVVESVHGTILHLMTRYFKDYFDHALGARNA
ncbi:MAG: hypothetical protein A3J58_00045 [Candidatus Sungbacteria bacterium RIFCSPHIGHO2_02_FULL_52_23]|uniref:SIS domain-containing protein n=1 Tax=Candidatus Sungbacteria bacterium RIFCSPHIGHO2_02_FULL_52_23 TaxID=1802274 RepID=A0A1G2KU11_9BACT|nr:MAG: hypothetical protein A3J58_00045 [Candidatus Sungbacteria bacterium RIFCSPHIGHO2_02_FULL_52_23]